MAGPGIVTATLMTGGCVMVIYSLGWGLTEWNIGTGNLGLYLAMLFGAVVSATDPVAVVALLKELGASKKLGTLIEGESLLNDGTAIVAFVVLIGAVTGASVFTVGSAVSGILCHRSGRRGAGHRGGPCRRGVGQAGVQRSTGGNLGDAGDSVPRFLRVRTFLRHLRRAGSGDAGPGWAARKSARKLSTSCTSFGSSPPSWPT